MRTPRSPSVSRTPRTRSGSRRRGGTAFTPSASLSRAFFFVGLLTVFGVPTLLLLLLPLVVLLRTALRCRFKSPSLPLRLLYAVHSHAQQIPILYGQWTYFRGLKAGRARALIEYKETPS